MNAVPWMLLAAEPPVEAPPALAPWAGLLLGTLLVLLNGFFVAAEFALVKLRPTQLEEAGTGLRVRLLQQMLAHLDAYLSASQLGITLASLALGWGGGPPSARRVRPPPGLLRRLLERLGAGDVLVPSIAATAAFLTIMVLHIVVGEQAPKTLAIRKPFEASLWIVLPIHAFYRAAYPAIWLLNRAANARLQVFGVEPVTEGE